MAKAQPKKRKALPLATRVDVLIEAGYRCAIPTCRGILALDLHHIVEVSAGGGDTPSNLIALCPTCHALHHRGDISADAIYFYKAILVALMSAFDKETIDRLLFLESVTKDSLVVSGDGVLHFARLIGAGLATADLKANNNWQLVTYVINITNKGRLLIEGWKKGDRTRLRETLSGTAISGPKSKKN